MMDTQTQETFYPDAGARPGRLRARRVLDFPGVRDGAAILAAIVMVLAVIALNGRPTVFPDTDDYFMEGQGVVRAAGNLLVHGKLPFDPASVSDHLNDPNAAEEEPIHNQDGARSAYYGAFLYGLHAIGTTWLMAAAQAGIVAGLMFALWRLAAPRARRRTYLALMAALAAATTLPFVAGFAMPDIFTSAAVIASLCLIVYDDRMGAALRIAVLATLAFALNSHPSHTLIVIALLACALPLLFWLRVPLMSFAKRAAMIAAAAAVAFAANAAYAAEIKMSSGDELSAPPFLTVRVLADGPGRNYLRAECGRSLHLSLCRYRNLPLKDGNEILWSDDPARGIFNAAEYPDRRRLAGEQMRFVLGAITYDPLGQMAASLRNWGEQLGDITLQELIAKPRNYLADKYWRTTNLPKLILGPGPCTASNNYCASRFSEPVLRSVHWTAIVLALAFLGWRLARPDVRGALARRDIGDGEVRAIVVIALLLAAVVLNAGVCGMISGAFGRYQARVAWLIPAAAILAAIALPTRRPAPIAPS